MPSPHNDPLRIAEIPVGARGGAIGVTFAPGRRGAGMTGVHARDLGADLDAVAAWGACAVVTLVEPFELDDLDIAPLGAQARRRFMAWHHWPIRDVSVPDAAFEAAWPARSAMLRELMARGGRVLVHCRGGLGRAGLVAARLLVEAGEAPPAQAIARVRAARPGALETTAQERWVALGAATPVARPDPAAARDRAQGALVGLAAGDAVGTTLEFRAKPAFAVLDDMVGGGPFDLAPGQWTDDTAMALALADSLLADPALDPADLMARFVRWRREGAYSCTGDCFDIGNQTARALDAFGRTGEPLAGPVEASFSGNGAIMRLAPVAIRHWRDRAELARVAALQTRTTHGSPATLDGSALLADTLADLVAGEPLGLVLDRAAARLPGWRGLPRSDVTGSGYVVHCLQAALWSVSRAGDFRSAVLLAANLGDDADTTAAVAGQIAGAAWGLSGIPGEWRRRLAWGERIADVAGALFDASFIARGASR